MRQIAYGLALFLSSACGLIIEIVAGRLLAPYVGMSLYTWTAIIAVVLSGLSAGHWIGGRLAAADVDAAKGGRRIAFALALAAVSSLGSLVLLRTLSGFLLTVGLTPIPAIVLLTTSLFLLPSLFVGIVSPILTKLAVDARPGQHGHVIGRMYALGTLGSIAGTLAAGYLFISWIGSTGTVITVALVYSLLALAFAIADPLRLLVLLLLAGGGGTFVLWGNTLKAFQSPCTVESDYFCIRIADFSADSGRESNLMVLDHLVHSINDRRDPGYLYSPYIQFVDEVVKLRFQDTWDSGKSAPAAFFIGGGGYSLPRAWAADYPKSKLTVAEIDPAVTAQARKSLWLDDQHPALTIFHRDARAVLQSLPRMPQFDVIFGDAFHDISIPSHLVTQEFHAEVAVRLKPGGFYALNVVDKGSNPRFLFSLIKTLKEDFPRVEAWINREDNGNTGRVTFVVLASDRATSEAALMSLRGPERSWVRWPEKDLSQRIARSKSPVLTDDYAPVDRLMSGLLLDDVP
ncbi:MAG: fused MFS/spermidine synthase [Rhodospirillales bacterium]|nr:fused MFS/spermidine synthase [Rhodospirillales bacterium]